VKHKLSIRILSKTSSYAVAGALLGVISPHQVLAAGAAVNPEPQSKRDAVEAKPAVESSTVAEARERFNRGLHLYEEGDFALALIEFERAHELVANYRVLYNIGQVCIQLHQYAQARIALEGYLAQGGDQVEAQRRAEVGADLENLKRRTAAVEVLTKKPGAEVLVDGLPVGTTPLPERLLLDMGEHKIEVRKPGYVSAERFFTLAGGDEKRIELDLVEQKEQTRTVEKTIVVKHPEKDSDSTWIWVGLGATGVLAAGAVATGVIGLSAVSDLEDLRNQVGVNRDAIEGAKSRASRMFLASDILAGAALVVGGTTLYFALTSDSEPEKVPLKVGVAPNGIWLSGRF
jgi:hypothetical protein